MEMESMLPSRHFVLTVCLVTLLAASQARPVVAAFGITGAVGAVELPGPPAPNLYPGNVEGALPIVFPEVINGVVRPTIAHPAGMDVDHNGSNVTASPVISGNVVNPALVSTTIPTGTQFNSYLFHFDPVGSPFFKFYVATINFDNPIIGVQLFSDGFLLNKPSGIPYTGTLEQGDTQIFLNGGSGPPPTYYPDGVTFRGVEEDAFVLAISGNTIQVGGSASGPEIDQIRIITAPTIQTGVPEPATATAWAIIALIGCCAAFVRQKQKKVLV
jgi:hypothetical protein